MHQRFSGGYTYSASKCGLSWSVVKCAKLLLEGIKEEMERLDNKANEEAIKDFVATGEDGNELASGLQKAG